MYGKNLEKIWKLKETFYQKFSQNLAFKVSMLSGCRIWSRISRREYFLCLFRFKPQFITIFVEKGDEKDNCANIWLDFFWGLSRKEWNLNRISIRHDPFCVIGLLSLELWRGKIREALKGFSSNEKQNQWKLSWHVVKFEIWDKFLDF